MPHCLCWSFYTYRPTVIVSDQMIGGGGGDDNYGRPLWSSEWSDEATIAVALPQAGGGASRRTATLTPLRDHTV